MRESIPGLEENRVAESIPAAKIEDGFNAQQIQETIRLRAYELYQQRGRKDGHDIEDWVNAEAEVNATLGAEGLKAA